MTDNSTPERTPRSVIDNISDTARQFVITKRPYHDHYHRRDVTEVRFELPGRFLMGAREEEPGYLILLHIGASHYEHQRKGYGVACLERAIKYAADNKLRFFANEFLTPETKRLVAALKRREYSVVIGPNNGMSSWSTDREPSVEFWTTASSFTDFDESPAS